VDIFDVYEDDFNAYDFQNQIDAISKNGELKEYLKLLGIVYSDSNLEKGNENRILFGFSKRRTIAIEVQLMEKKIRFWGWIGTRLEGDYFWKYVIENYEELWRSVLNLLISEYFSPVESISCEIVAATESDLFCRWLEGTESIEDNEDE
jgi:hypothetical protein